MIKKCFVCKGRGKVFRPHWIEGFKDCNLCNGTGVLVYPEGEAV